MSAVPYAHIVQGPATIRPLGPAVVPRSTGINPLIPICCAGLILLLIASSIILALIPVYLRTRGDYYASEVVPFTTLYRLNNGFLPTGDLTSANCAAIQQDQRNQAAANTNVAPSVPTLTQCTNSGNTSLSRRRRESQPMGNLITLTGYLSNSKNCRRGRCLIRRGEAFRLFLINRGIFFITLILANGNPFQFSISIISIIVFPTQIIGSTNNTAGTSVDSLPNDIAILNYALILEQLESAFYTQYQANFTAKDFIAANFTQQTYDYFNIILVHEQAHVRALVAIIKQLGGTPVSACTYNFSMVTDVSSYITVARLLENTGTMAYAGAVNGIADSVLRQVSATVATVEGRHTAYLNTLKGLSPFPTQFENATVPSVVIQSVMPFIVSCPFTITAPIVPYIGATSYTGTVPTSNDASVSPYTTAKYNNDMNALNYALITEQLEATYYNQYVSNYTSADYVKNGFPDASLYFIIIREHENAHVQFLRMTITQRGGTPVSVCTYNFPVTSVTSFVNLSSIFENTGVKAYDGAINTITDPNLIMSAATIATVEARHASYLNKIQGLIPFPNVTDPTLTPTQVVAALGAFQSCPFTVQIPVVLNASTFVPNS